MTRLTTRSGALAALALAVLLALGSVSALAARLEPFDQRRFEAAQAGRKPIVIDITADWCPTCAAQRPIIESLAADPVFQDLVVFHVDFDAQKDVVRMLGAQMQSTLIAFDGKLETGRSVGDTDQRSIAALFRSALGE